MTETVPDAAGRIAELERVLQDLALSYHRRVHNTYRVFGLCPNPRCVEVREALAGGHVGRHDGGV